MKNTMLIPLVTITFFFGWWIYFAVPNGPGITGGLVVAPWAVPWSELMGPHIGGKPATAALTADDTMALGPPINGVFWAAFLLFSWTAASIVSGAVIERVRSMAFWFLAVLVGSVTWVIDASWGWHPEGWMVPLLGYHDAYASGVIHAIAGGSALAYLHLLGPRIGKFAADGSPRDLAPHNPWLVTVGLFLIYTGFWGFYAACNVPIIDVQSGDGVFFSATNIYLQPTTLSGITANFLMSLSGGMMTGYWMSKGNGFWTYSGGLAGIIAASAGNGPLPPDPGHDYRRVWRHLHVQGPLLRGAPLQDRRRGGRRGRAWLRRLVRGGGRRLRAVGLSVFAQSGLRSDYPVGPVHRRHDHVLGDSASFPPTFSAGYARRRGFSGSLRKSNLPDWTWAKYSLTTVSATR